MSGLAGLITAVYLALIIGVGSAVDSRFDAWLAAGAAALTALALAPARGRLLALAVRLRHAPGPGAAADGPGAGTATRHRQLRVVEALDEERRRLERDLHDGAQQRLVT